GAFFVPRSKRDKPSSGNVPSTAEYAGSHVTPGVAPARLSTFFVFAKIASSAASAWAVCQRRATLSLPTDHRAVLPRDDRKLTRSTSSARVSTSVRPSGISDVLLGV